MKLIIFLTSIVFSSVCLAQDPDPNLFQTWYLYSFDDDGFPQNISEIEPSIEPYLTILEDYSFNGQGACNSFNGIYSFPAGTDFIATEFNSTTDECDAQIHNYFENFYFELLEYGGKYEVLEDTNGYILELSTPLMSYAEFRNYPLSTNNFNLNSIKIYPNPSDSEIRISSSEHIVSKIEIYDLNGKKTSSLTNNIETINISNLKAGNYLIKIFTNNGILVKNIIKK
tara:strand:- start:152 stop:832 length:681 start_codon:yes stop_codon:yes gene_type:complete